MSRIALVRLAAGALSWDAVLDLNFDILDSGPLPVVVYATPADLPAADASNVNCIAATTTPKELWMSDGAAWRTFGAGVLNMNGARGGHRMATAVIDVAVSPTAAGIFPAGCVKKGVTGRVLTTTTFGGGGASTHVGDGTDVDRYKAGLSSVIGSTFTPANITAPSLEQLAAAGDVTLTPNAGTFATGTFRIVVAYDELTAPTS